MWAEIESYWSYWMLFLVLKSFCCIIIIYQFNILQSLEDVTIRYLDGLLFVCTSGIFFKKNYYYNIGNYTLQGEEMPSEPELIGGLHLRSFAIWRTIFGVKNCTLFEKFNILFYSDSKYISSLRRTENAYRTGSSEGGCCASLIYWLVFK